VNLPLSSAADPAGWHHLDDATNHTRARKGSCSVSEAAPVRRGRGYAGRRSVRGVGLSRPGECPPYFYDLVHVLALIVPVLFMVGLAALYARCAGRTAWLGKTEIILSFIGSVLGAVKGLVNASVPSLYPYSALSGRIHLLLDVWTPALFAGLLLGVLALAATRALRSWGALLLAMGVVGWAYCVTDSGAILEDRLIHVGFGLMFCLGWVALGLTLWLAEP
jgi:hypothetical protein